MSEEGTVKWFNDSKGYGFITRAGQDDLFVHISEVLNADSLQENDKVEFEEEQGKKGMQAVKVKRLEE